MKPTLVVGDLHGRIEIVEDVLARDEYNIVFVGDYVDSYDRSVDDMVRTLRAVTDAARDNPERVRALYGNHELAYMHKIMQCSGNTAAMSVHIMHIDMAPLKPYLWVGDYLVSHAGVSKRLLSALDTTLEAYLEAESFFQIGAARGGYDACGGLYWCDWFKEFQPLDTPQIVGHTGYRPPGEHEGVIKKRNSYNVDCFEYSKEVLIVLGTGVEVLKL